MSAVLATFGAVTARRTGPNLAVTVYSGNVEAGEVVAVLRPNGRHSLPRGVVRGDRGTRFVAECAAAGIAP